MCVTTANRAKGHGRQRGPGRELASWAASTRWTLQLSHRGGGGSLQPRQPPHTHTHPGACSGGPDVLQELAPERLLTVAAPSAGHLCWLPQGRGPGAWRAGAGPEGRALRGTATCRRAAAPARSFLNVPL